MGKYGNGVSMKSAIETEVKEVTDILNRSNLGEEDKNIIIDALKEMAYQWCNSNAFGCAMEKLIKEQCPDMTDMMIMEKLLKDGIREKKMKETFPF